MDIPYQKLPPETLRAVIAEYVTREGTDYGDRVYTLEEKISEVQLQLKQGTAKIIFNPDDETCNVVAVS